MMLPLQVTLVLLVFAISGPTQGQPPPPPTPSSPPNTYAYVHPNSAQPNNQNSYYTYQSPNLKEPYYAPPPYVSPSSFPNTTDWLLIIGSIFGLLLLYLLKKYADLQGDHQALSYNVAANNQAQGRVNEHFSQTLQSGFQQLNDFKSCQLGFNREIVNRMSTSERHFAGEIDAIRKEHRSLEADIGRQIQAQGSINGHFQRAIGELTDFSGRQIGFNQAIAHQMAENDRKAIAYHNERTPTLVCTIQ